MSILTLPAPIVNFEFSAIAPVTTPTVQGVADDFRPTFDLSYYPTLDDDREAREMFGDSGDETDDDDFGPPAESSSWDEMAEDAAAMDRICSGTPWL